MTKIKGMRRFVLRRDEDVSGTSGIGIVAEGCVFSSGYVALTWLSHLGAWAFYHSIDTLMAIHGHDGRTEVDYVDSEDSGDIRCTGTLVHSEYDICPVHDRK